ncbi:peptidase C1 [Pseudomonas sp. LS1212]|uniref:C1 family peptidase n=1 Tax=Pseudomonas sp. LS1212 TaxID=2972478 RepID=UPI00215BEEE6|nr:C1 family peptidase [Pseudomonas sp. LS1212]UVJ46418.1 peptidase C1 [Pseudomonas sp. LS1212]
MDILLGRNKSGADVVELRDKLASVLGEDGQGFAGLAGGTDFDALTESAVRHWQSGIGIVADGVVGPYCQSLLGLLKLKALDARLGVDAVNPLFPATKPSNIQRYLPYICAALAAAGLTDSPMILAALGTIRAETEGFVPISEFPSQYNTKAGMAAFSAYEGKQDLGNLKPGDGAVFRGRGFVQLTGRHNYQIYSQKIGLNILDQPDLANAPEVAAVLLATFLADRADRIRTALVSDNYRAARKAVNGGSHGLDRFKDVFRIAASAWQPAATQKATKAKAGKAAAPVAVTRRLNASKDPADLRDRVYMPPPLSLPDIYPSTAEINKFLPRYSQSGLILDQGREGACTGFGLACVVNYLRWRKNGLGNGLEAVSPRMLYNFARRYDEYAGEDYEGSSCRGALKGWHHHGVCLESDWPYDDEDTQPPKYGYASRATANTLGVYYRIDIRSITDLQAAIYEVGAIYVSAFTHDGWNQVPKPDGKLNGHSSLPVLPFDGKPSQDGGHAFALVGFNSNGFIVQNSWGINWGNGGFALLTYADWLANGMDAWVVALGVPDVLLGQPVAAGGALGTAKAAVNGGLWWDETKAYDHSVVMGNDGRITRHLTQDELSRSLLHQACGLPDQWFRTQPGDTKRLLIFVHGGLNSEASAIQRARAMGRFFLGNGCYPLFVIWKTGVLESISGIITDMFRREPARVGGVRDTIMDGADMLLERGIARPFARPIWSEMKENAEFASLPTRGGDKLVTALQNLARTWGSNLEIHLVGHSAGAIFLGHLVDLLAVRELTESIGSIHLYAPACTVQFANRHYAPHKELMTRLYMDVLSDRNERDDSVGPYRKSLLYLVSNALEGDLRTPILGQANVLDPTYMGWDGSSSTGEALGNWRQAVASAGLVKRKQIGIVDASKVITRRPSITIDATHGSFDNNVDVVGRTLERITGAKLAMPMDDLHGF